MFICDWHRGAQHCSTEQQHIASGFNVHLWLTSWSTTLLYWATAHCQWLQCSSVIDVVKHIIALLSNSTLPVASMFICDWRRGAHRCSIEQQHIASGFNVHLWLTSWSTSLLYWATAHCQWLQCSSVLDIFKELNQLWRTHGLTMSELFWQLCFISSGCDMQHFSLLQKSRTLDNSYSWTFTALRGSIGCHLSLC